VHVVIVSQQQQRGRDGCVIITEASAGSAVMRARAAQLGRLPAWLYPASGVGVGATATSEIGVKTSLALQAATIRVASKMTQSNVSKTVYGFRQIHAANKAAAVVDGPVKINDTTEKALKVANTTYRCKLKKAACKAHARAYAEVVKEGWKV
jgi:hypothetical protein